MKFPRSARIFRGHLDVAPFASVFFLLVIFALLGALIYTPGIPVELQLPEANDLPTGGRLSNSALYFHNRYKLTNNVDLGASYLFWSTRYKGQAAGTDHRIQMFIQHNF